MMFDPRAPLSRWAADVAVGVAVLVLVWFATLGFELLLMGKL